MRSNRSTFKKKLAIILDKILQIILFIVFLPFILVFEGSSRVFQFLADFNQKCSDILMDKIASYIYYFISGLIIGAIGVQVDERNRKDV